MLKYEDMWHRFVIEGPDGAPLGETEEVLEQLSQALPDLNYEWLMREPIRGAHGLLNPWEKLVFWLRRLFNVGFPAVEGYIAASGCFFFRAKSPVMRIMIGHVDASLDARFEQLFARTGWVRKPANRWLGL